MSDIVVCGSDERFWNEPPSFCMASRNGIVIMLAQLERTGVMRPNRTVDPEGGAWDAYIWIENADALYAEFRSKGVKINSLRAITDEELKARFNPRDMLAKEIYPGIWTREPEEDDTLGYLMEHVQILRGFLDQTVDQGLGILVYIS